MTQKKSPLRFFLDECVPDGVGHFLTDSGHDVIHLRDAAATGSPDPLVCAVAEINLAILVSFDGDMKKLASRRGIGRRTFAKLSLIKLSCKGPNAVERVTAALSLIEHEWAFSAARRDRRLFIEIGHQSIATKR